MKEVPCEHIFRHPWYRVIVTGNESIIHILENNKINVLIETEYWGLGLGEIPSRFWKSNLGLKWLPSDRA